MRKEFTEHESVIGFRVIARKFYVFVHIEGYNILESKIKNTLSTRSSGYPGAVLTIISSL